MAKEFFKNLPDTTTPLIATRLNGLLDGEEPMGNLVVDSIRSKNMLNIETMFPASTGGSGTDIETSNSIVITSRTKNSISFTTSANWQGVACNYIEVEPSTQYILSFQNSAGASQSYSKIVCYDSTKTMLQDFSQTGNLAHTITTPANTRYIRVVIEKISSTSTAIILSNIQLEKGSTATSYSSYQELNNQEVYSTTEIKIGKWIDGKPLYRKVIIWSETNYIQQNTVLSLAHGISNLNEVIKCNGMVKWSNKFMPMTTHYTNQQNEIAINTIDNNNINFTSYNENWGATRIVFILEYTKTTD